MTYWRRRSNPLPLLATIVAGVWVYGFTFVGVGHGHVGHDDHDHSATHTTSVWSGSRLVSVWAGLAILVVAQLFDLWRVRAPG